MPTSNSLPNVVSIFHKKSNTFNRTIEMQKDGVPFDLTGHLFKFQIRDRRGATILITKTTGAGITHLPTIGQMALEIPSAEFNAGAFLACECKCVYSYEFEMTEPDTTVTTPFCGPFNLIPFAGYGNSGVINGTSIVVNITTDTIIVNIQSGAMNPQSWLDSLPIYNSDDLALAGGVPPMGYYKTGTQHVDSPSGLPKQIL